MNMDSLSEKHHLPGGHAKRNPHNLSREGEPIISILSGFEDAVQLFRELENDCVMTAFQTRLWLECWMEQLARPKGVDMLFCVVRSHSGSLLMVLPLCMRPNAGLRIIEGPDLGVTDYLAPIIAPTFLPSPAQWNALWRRIVVALPEHDILRVTKVPRHIGARPNPLAWTAGGAKLELQAHGIAVFTPWDTCARQIFSSNRREKLKKGWRGLARSGDIGFRVVEDPAEMAVLFDQLVVQRLRRFEALQRNDPLHDQEIVGFYKKLIERGAGSGYTRLALITAGDQTVAMQFGVCHAGAFHLLIQTFFDGPWARLAPGMLLAARTMQWAAEEGLGYYDFTIGNEDYKSRLGANACDLMEIVSVGSWRGLPTVALVRAKAWARRQPWILAAVRKWQGLRSGHG